ncbi:MAG: aminodeoxychorismate/anthranilate synthase component II [Corynebacteriales bacterium]|nr:aminodeoxychorismate/anthranilate synthase component II [Mycobacteriales bacterium]
MTTKSPTTSASHQAPANNGRILVVDNYDSFVYNIVQYLGQLGADVLVARNDELTIEEIADGNYHGLPIDGILLSPGPGTPNDSGVCLDVLQAARSGDLRVPVFGVCLGLQAMGAVFGGTVERAPELLHGKTSEVLHENTGVLAGLPNPLIATRYHSLAVRADTVPEEFQVTGNTASGIVMALKHRSLAIEGVQFHPESVLTQGGHLILANWLASCGFPNALERAVPLAAEMEKHRLAAFV